MAVQAIPFGSSGFGLPYAIFNATSFGGWNNSSGTNGAGGIFGNVHGTNTPGAPGTNQTSVAPFEQVQQGVTQSLLSAQSDALQGTINNSLATISDQGAWLVSGVGSLFNSWFGNIASVNSSAAQSLSTAVSKSANGCSGFLSCLFG